MRLLRRRVQRRRIQFNPDGTEKREAIEELCELLYGAGRGADERAGIFRLVPAEDFEVVFPSNVMIVRHRGDPSGVFHLLLPNGDENSCLASVEQAAHAAHQLDYVFMTSGRRNRRAHADHLVLS